MDESRRKRIRELCADASTVMAEVKGKSEQIVLPSALDGDPARVAAAAAAERTERRVHSHENLPSEFKDGLRKNAIKFIQFKVKVPSQLDDGDDEEEVEEEGEVEIDTLKADPNNNWYSDMRNEPVVHPLSRIVRRTIEASETSSSSTRPFDVGRARTLLEIVPKAHEDSYLRAPGIGEEPCVRGQLCAGMRLGCIDGWPRNVAPFVLARFYTPQEESGARRRSTHGLCLMCLRERVTTEYLETMASRTPIHTILHPYRVTVNVPGEYAVSAAIPRTLTVSPATQLTTNGGQRFTGITDPFIYFRFSRYEWRDGALRQKNVDFFDDAPRIFPTTFQRMNYTSSHVVDAGRSLPQLVGMKLERDEDAEFVKRCARVSVEDARRLLTLERARIAMRATADFSNKEHWGVFRATVEEEERTLARLSEASRTPSVPRLIPETLAFSLSRLPDCTIDVPLCGLIQTETEIVRSLFKRTVPTFRELMTRALNVERVPSDFAARYAEGVVASHAIRVWAATLIRCSLGGFYPWSAIEPGVRKRFLLMENLCVKTVVAYANLAAACIREFVCCAVLDDDVLSETVKRHKKEWPVFFASTTSTMNDVRRVFANFFSTAGADTGTGTDAAPAKTFSEMMERLDAYLEKTRRSSLRPTPEWFWHRAFEHLSSAVDPDDEYDIREVRMFDPRHAYDGVDAVLKHATSDAGYSSEACDAIRKLQDAKSVSAVSASTVPNATLREAYLIAMIVSDCFRLRAIRAPHHWIDPTMVQTHHVDTTFLTCTKCQSVKRTGRKDRFVYDFDLRKYYCGKKPPKTPGRRRKGARAQIPSLCDYAQRCQDTECVPIEIYGNVVEFFGRLLTTCSNCLTNVYWFDDAGFENVCAKCAADIAAPRSIKCEACGAGFKKNSKKTWLRVRVFDEPSDRAEVWICQLHQERWMTKGENAEWWSYPIFVRNLRGGR